MFNFINNTSHFQINDARQLPIVIPSEQELDIFHNIFIAAEEIKKQQFASLLTSQEADNFLIKIQNRLDKTVSELYRI